VSVEYRLQLNDLTETRAQRRRTGESLSICIFTISFTKNEEIYKKFQKKKTNQQKENKNKT